MKTPETIRALYLESGGTPPVCKLGDIPGSVLADGDVLIRVECSSLNYKDAMMLKGLGYNLKEFPFIPGIDVAGVVEDSDHADFKAGDKVVLNGYGTGESTSGGFASHVRTRGDCLVAVPDGMTTQDTMTIGTAGLTAMLSVMFMEHEGVSPKSGDILVTGAAGGVGSVSIAILSALGYRVEASTGRMEEADYLKSLGAASVISRSELENGPERPLMVRRWAGCIDSVGGGTFSTVLSSLHKRGVIASCGLAASNQSEISLLPFLLRGTRVVGIDGGYGPIEERKEAWARIASTLTSDQFAAMRTVVPLSDVLGLADEIIGGRVRGRTVIMVDQ